MPLLARAGSVETWQAPEGGSETSIPYQQQYESEQPAREYNEAYRDRFTKRLTTRRELRLLTGVVERGGRCETLLDLPSGGGRLAASLEPHTGQLFQADIGLGQLIYARERFLRSGSDHSPPIQFTASAFHIPLKDDSVDATVCCRLCHHLPTVAERERLIEELLRVSRRFVVMSFFDYHSVKNLLRRARRQFDGKPPKLTMTVQRVAELARENGAELVAWPSLSRLFSGHRYALMKKE